MDVQAGLHLCCLHMTKTGFFMMWLKFSMPVFHQSLKVAFEKSFVEQSSSFHLTCTKYKENYCSHPGRLRPRNSVKVYMQVSQKFIFQQPLIRKHLYLEHRYPRGSTLTPGLEVKI